EFSPDQTLPIIPFSDGAGEVVKVGAGVSRVAVGDLVTPLFFPCWISGEALGDERSTSRGLEVPGVLREYGVFDEDAVARAASHLSAEEAACYPCAGLTAWTSLVPVSGIGPGDYVLLQGTGGVSIMALQFAKALGAQVMITSSSDEKLERARQLGADLCVNYKSSPEWGEAALEWTGGRGVDAVIEIGGTGTLPKSIQAIRRGGHIPVIGYLAGAAIELTVFDLIIKNANLHGIGVGNRDNYETMMQFVAKHQLRPVIHKSYSFENAGQALSDLPMGQHLGKLTVKIAVS
ncbi:MAG: NAD(P)-dependent alcohol dehydrogenase, partial [Gammaproteobacteria bacterium]